MRVFCAPTPADYCCDLIVFFKHELRENARSGKLDTILLFVGGLRNVGGLEPVGGYPRV